jgi:hypothetical protein
MSAIAEPARLANLWGRIRAMLERARADIGAFDPLAALSRARRLSIARWIALIETIVRKVLFVEAAALVVAERATQAPYNGPHLTIIPLRTFALASHGAPPIDMMRANPPPLEGEGARGRGDGSGRDDANGKEYVQHLNRCAPHWLRAARARATPTLAVAPTPAPPPSRGRGVSVLVGTRRATAFDTTKPETWRVRFALKPPRDPRLCKHRPRIRALWGDYVEPPKPPPRAHHSTKPSALRLAMRFEAVRRVLENPAPHVRRLALLMPRLCRRDSHAPMRYATETARPHWSDAVDPRLIVEAIGLALSAAPLFHNSS